jgi:hypothetical protein
MIRGVRALLHSSDPHATRAFLRDQLGLSGHDLGAGYWIFTLSEVDVACTRPGSEDPSDAAGLSLVCDDLRRTVAELESRGVQLTHEIEDHGYALVTYLSAPGGVTIMLYEPRTKAPRKSRVKPPAKRSRR